MLKWCSYCQHFLGEKEPYEILEFTHGICENCRKLGRQKDAAHLKNLRPIIDFYNNLKDRALRSERLQLSEVIAESKQLGLSPLDTAIGVLQPALTEMGTLYAQGKVTAAKEHAFTTFVDRMVTHLLASSNGLVLSDEMQPSVVLTCIDGNYHWLGLKLLELALLEEQVPTRLFIPSLPTAEIIQLALEMRPQVLGISIFDRTQTVEAQNILAGIRAGTIDGYVPKIAVGGNGARVFLDEHGVDQLIEDDVGYFRQAYDFTNFLKSFLKKSA